MKYFFADSQDMVDPTFDFQSETRAEWRVRQRHDLYPHEIFSETPYDGILVSKAMVDGNRSTGSRYSLAQRQRFWRSGVRAFFRLDKSERPPENSRPGPTIRTMGDCGAFSYVKEETPPLTTDEVVEFYERCGFDYGISVDHVILGFESGPRLPGFDDALIEWRRRQEITLEMASEFRERCRSSRVSFAPLGVAQGWSPESYSHAVEALQKIGYRRIALGGMVPLKTASILQCLEEIKAVRHPDTTFHLLGITRCEHIPTFKKYGVTSFDSTSPFLQAFRDGKDNYHSAEKNYLAVRVPQVDGNHQLQGRIRSGELSQDTVRRLEKDCLQALSDYDDRRLSLETTLERVVEYEQVHHPRVNRAEAYREVLCERPWDYCTCEICETIGIQVILFRGTERNKRRGFHNLSIFFERLRKELAGAGL